MTKLCVFSDFHATKNWWFEKKTGVSFFSSMAICKDFVHHHPILIGSLGVRVMWGVQASKMAISTPGLGVFPNRQMHKEHQCYVPELVFGQGSPVLGWRHGSRVPPIHHLTRSPWFPQLDVQSRANPLPKWRPGEVKVNILSTCVFAKAKNENHTLLWWRLLLIGLSTLHPIL